MKAILFGASALVLSLTGCTNDGSSPVTVAQVPCDDASVLALPRFTVTTHKHPEWVRDTLAMLPGTQWASGDSVKAFFGGRDMKLVFTLNLEMYLLTYTAGVPTVTRISHDDEGVGPTVGSINSPLFSPDGKKIVYAGTSRGKPAFIQDATPGVATVLRMPLDPEARTTSDPHWHSEGGKTWIYFATLPGLVNFSSACNQVVGSTYRIEVLGDTMLGPIQTTGIRGAYRGGLSKDGQWVGTAYATSTLFNMKTDSTVILDGGEQQCNPSMNPYPVGSKHVDYMMILAFGGALYPSITGTDITEGLHENLWIYNADNKIVWQAKRPDEAYYAQWDKPEWSTDPDFATAIALRRGDGDGDLYVVKVGDLANADEGRLNQAQGYLRIGTGGFTSDSYSHLWVAP